MNGRSAKFTIIESDFDSSRRVRAYDITFSFPGFRTHEHLHQAGVNVATLRFSYSPRRKLMEFESFCTYINSFKDRSMTLEEAAWNVVDDVFTYLEPLHCRVDIKCGLNDGVCVEVSAKRGWRAISNPDTFDALDMAVA